MVEADGKRGAGAGFRSRAHRLQNNKRNLISIEAHVRTRFTIKTLFLTLI